MGMMINRRRVCGGKKGLPYDAEIEYLESSGTQWIDTEYIPSANGEIFFDFQMMSLTGNQALLGTYGSGHHEYQIYVTNSRYFYVQYGSYVGWELDTNRHIFYDNLQTAILIMDGVSHSHANFITTSANKNWYVFDCNHSDRISASMRVFSLKLCNGDTVIRDFIPVRVGTTGYLYDKVSKQLFGNAGTGSFILGADKVAVTQPVIDMGLPSGTLWAQGNIIKDANDNYAIGEPTDYGCYFSWGNIDGHNEGEGYSFDSANYALTPGSQLTGNIPSDDAEHDAAVARIGGRFHLPSGDQMTELFNSEYTTNEWTTLNGVNGRRVTSLVNGNSVFFPATGYYDGLSLNNRGLNGYYWSSRRSSDSSAYRMYFNSESVYPQSSTRKYRGFLVRAVLNV